jgi:biofilm PGA synthesis N-glycosyltransferase PgaC
VIEAALRAIDHSPIYHVALVFFAFYPVVTSVMWSSTAATYFFRREYRRPVAPPPLTRFPRVTMLLPCRDEEVHIEETLEACLRQDYRNLEVVVVDDGSVDGTVDRVVPFVRAGTVRLVTKETNEGKAMAINDALPLITGEIVVVMDADAVPAPDMVRYLVPHFESPRVAAVTGNPRVADRQEFLAKLQMLEFTSIVSILRRAQRIWGRILTVSGVVTAFRVSALVDVGLFSPDMATEDIDMTWKLQKRYYDVRYEPGALVWMRVPRSARYLWRQRRRWALGLVQVLRRHVGDLLHWPRRRMWPVMVEAILSILWAYTFVILTAFWGLSYGLGHPPVGASPIPNWWGMLIATLSLVQLGTGVLLDRQYDRDIVKYFPFAVFYPIVYWIFMAIITVISTPAGLFGKRERGPTRWNIPRQPGRSPEPSAERMDLQPERRASP